MLQNKRYIGKNHCSKHDGSYVWFSEATGPISSLGHCESSVVGSNTSHRNSDVSNKAVLWCNFAMIHGYRAFCPASLTLQKIVWVTQYSKLFSVSHMVSRLQCHSSVYISSPTLRFFVPPASYSKYIEIFTSFLHVILTPRSLCFFCLEHCSSLCIQPLLSDSLFAICKVLLGAINGKSRIMRLHTMRIYFSFASESSDSISHWEAFFISILEPKFFLF